METFESKVCSKLNFAVLQERKSGPGWILCKTLRNLSVGPVTEEFLELSSEFLTEYKDHVSVNCSCYIWGKSNWDPTPGSIFDLDVYFVPRIRQTHCTQYSSSLWSTSVSRGVVSSSEVRPLQGVTKPALATWLEVLSEYREQSYQMIDSVLIV